MNNYPPTASPCFCLATLAGEALAGAGKCGPNWPLA